MSIFPFAISALIMDGLIKFWDKNGPVNVESIACFVIYILCESLIFGVSILAFISGFVYYTRFELDNCKIVCRTFGAIRHYSFFECREIKVHSIRGSLLCSFVFNDGREDRKLSFSGTFFMEKYNIVVDKIVECNPNVVVINKIDG